MTITKTETNKARDARIDVQEAAERYCHRHFSATYASRLCDAAIVFSTVPQRADSHAARALETWLLTAIGMAETHTQQQRDLLAIWVAYANWKSAAR